ncbi:hypothetical protein [Thioclava sp. F1Mire-8]|uniref:hypothetical protein n=1 Tax=Thioclava sp. F1Mire-8 TaxID=1973006 RepID=UPI00198016A6|nr:hypothetical protein [Thioclava sp. F1Mire-8]
MRYILVDETRMIDEKSVLLAHNTTVTSEDKGLIKFVLTGIDGSSIEQVRSADQLKAARDGQLEILAQMADELRSSIDETISLDRLEELHSEAEINREELHEVLSARQDELDDYASKIRSLDEGLRETYSTISDLNQMISRFSELSAIYKSDIERLYGLEEGGFLLKRFAEINCPLCGALPEHQHHDHGLSRVEEQREAVAAEIAKISRDASELDQAISDANGRIQALEAEILESNARRAELVSSQENARAKELTSRELFLSESEKVSKFSNQIEFRHRLTSIEKRIERVGNQAVRSRQRADGIDANVDLTQSEAFELSNEIKDVLHAWNYPGANALHFEKSDHDIVVDGKRRRDNGAGVRALLHSAFKVGVLTYCIRKNRPHPGFLILDSPLLAYRPADEGRYGELQTDELELQQAGVAHHFYEHLDGLRDHAQFIVIENHRSDQEVVEPFSNVRFTLDSDFGRRGLFT